MVRLFASYAQAAGFREREVELPGGATAADVLALLRRTVLLTLPGIGRPLIAVNRQHVEASHPVAEGDEVGIFPPVSGGMDDGLVVTAAPLDVARLSAFVRSPECGAVVVFEGAVRSDAGEPVVAIEYEAYPEMAEVSLAGIRAEVMARFPGARLAMGHRMGRLTVGETSVVIACAAPHRREAFAACRLAMDRVKESLPVWKREEAPSGARTWK